jgi:uncharacterized protein YyaL (SSP411 family)
MTSVIAVVFWAVVVTHTNRLIHERSPYLQQHAHNPVDWFPWGEEAFANACRENKPIFLSIGYSTCHWCHVMERESFENEEIAALMNEHFVSIKVDREERPDIDKIYMTATQATTGGGGWPMSVWLTPDLKPFYCGTYFPPDARWGRPGFRETLQRIHEVWESNQAGILDQANRLTEMVAEQTRLAPRGGKLDAAPLQLGLEQFRAGYDATNGGFGGAPKFPRPAVLNLLFRAGGTDMALHTLRRMGVGGIFDHLGGGFHRYSVDERWLVSHFEKMLYDQAQLVSSYIDAYQITHDLFFADVARRTCDYVLRDMTSPDGGFYSAEDADSEGIEGRFYVWTRAEVEKILGDKAAAFCRAYDVDTPGNWEDGKNVLHCVMPGNFAEERAKLFAVRQRRVRPHRDEKIITAWNGLMISALACAAQTLNEPRYLAAAQKAARLVYRDGKITRSGGVRAILDDYAFLANAFVDLYETDFDAGWLRCATGLAETMLKKFYAPTDGGFFMTDGEDPSVLVRVKEDYDGAEPSGNSIATLLLLRLAQITGNERYDAAARQTLQLFSAHLNRAPHAVPQMLCALDFALGKPRQIVLAGKPSDAMLRAIRDRYLPNKVVMMASEQKEPRPLIDGKPTAYVCEDFACKLPTNDPERLKKLLE